MNTKEILLSGGRISFPYKEEKKQWMGNAVISVFVYCDDPKIILEIPTYDIKGRKEFKYSEIDEAISLFESLVFNKKNLAYKMHESLVELANQGIYPELDDEDEFEIMENLRIKLMISTLVDDSVVK